MNFKTTMLTCALACTLSACSTSAKTAPVASTAASSVTPITISNPSGVLQSILEKKVLTVATSPDYPPFEFVDATSGEVMGSDMMLAQYIADQLGVQLQIETMDFSGVLTAVDTGKADLAISGLGYKKDRAESYELSIGYQTDSSAACHGFLIPSEDQEAYQSLHDFDGKTISAQASSLQQMYVEDEIQNPNLQLVATLDQAILDLTTEKVDAVALDCDTAKNYAAQSDGKFVKSSVEFDLTPYAEFAGNVIAAKKGETSLMEAVNTIIQEVNEKKLYTTWHEEAKAQAGLEE